MSLSVEKEKCRSESKVADTQDIHKLVNTYILKYTIMNHKYITMCIILVYQRLGFLSYLPTTRERADIGTCCVRWCVLV